MIFLILPRITRLNRLILHHSRFIIYYNADALIILTIVWQIIQDIQEYEAILAAASDKGDQLSHEGNISDRNEITEQLQSRKQQLHNLRKTVEKLRQQNEKRAAESEKLGSELEEIIEALHARETAVKTVPLLSLEVTSVDVELDKQRVSPFPFHPLYHSIN